MKHKNHVIPLSQAPGHGLAWSKPKIVIGLWILAEALFVTNSLQLSSKIRVAILRIFGAKIGKNVIARPRLRITYPWNLQVGDSCWIGEGVWIHNQDKVMIANDVCVSQETFITTGSHNYKTDMGLTLSPVVIHAGVWVCSRAIITSGSVIGESALIPAGMVVRGIVPPGVIYDSSKLKPKSRFAI